MLPISAYPRLKKPTRNGQEHMGWALKVEKVSVKKPRAQSTVWIKEKGETATGVPLHEAEQMILLSV